MEDQNSTDSDYETAKDIAENINNGNIPINSELVPENLPKINSLQSSNPIPTAFELYQNDPNPFNPLTSIKFDVPKSGQIQLIIYDELGRHVQTLIDNYYQAGQFTSIWDGTNENNIPVAAGVYFCRMVAGEYVKVIKLAFVR